MVGDQRKETRWWSWATTVGSRGRQESFPGLATASSFQPLPSPDLGRWWAEGVGEGLGRRMVRVRGGGQGNRGGQPPCKVGLGCLSARAARAPWLCWERWRAGGGPGSLRPPGPISAPQKFARALREQPGVIPGQVGGRGEPWRKGWRLTPVRLGWARLPSRQGRARRR